MRRRVIAGNWKMNIDHREGAALASAILEGVKDRQPQCEVVVIPAFTALPAVSEVLSGSLIETGAQNLWYEEKGAFTGEISGAMIAALGCRYVLVGHSERRHIIGEDAGILSLKLRAALKAGLLPIYCVGELLEQRESGKAEEVVEGQMKILEGLEPDEISHVIIAYEPVWAIGTGKTATPEDASVMHAAIRRILGEKFSPGMAEDAIILYGGSVKPENASSLLGMDDIDGVLVGGASMKADLFLGIISPS